MRFQKLVLLSISSVMAETRKNWTDFEDKAISTLVKRYGTKNWAQISQKMSSKYGIDMRTGKQCRERWHNHLNPNVNKQSWSQKDEQIMFEAHQKYGNKWTLIAKMFEGRTDNDIKNHFYSMLRRSLRRINKLLGKRNSTQKIRVIKPAVLSKVFAKQTKDNVETNQEDGKKIAEALFQLSRAKTITNLTDSIDMQDKRKFEELIEKLSYYNEEYESSQILRRESKNSQKNLVKNEIQQPEEKIKRKATQSTPKGPKNPKRLLRNQTSAKQDKPKPEKQNTKQAKKTEPIDVKPKRQSQTTKQHAVKEHKEMVPEPEEQQGGYMTRLKKKQSQNSYFPCEELNLPPDLFEIESLHSFRKKNSTNSNKNNNVSSFSPGFTPSSQLNPGFLNSFSPSAGRNWTPLCPSPHLNNIFSHMVDYQWKSNNEDLDAIVNQTRRNIEKQNIHYNDQEQ